MDYGPYQVKKNIMDSRITLENFHRIWASILIKATDKYTTPPEVIHVSNSTISTLGNFSASTGKGKSKKTFNVCAIVASAITGRKVLNYEAHFPEGKRKILYFDTEQSSYHCHKVLERINRLAGYPAEEDLSLIEFVMLREYNPIDRRQIIELALAERPDVGLVIIDGLRDLLFDINSSIEAAEVIGLLMRWTSQYNLHIHTVLHLNKADDNVRGHIGTELNHKAETILQISRNEDDGKVSEVHATLIRDRDFPPFAFQINDEGLPEWHPDYQEQPRDDLGRWTRPSTVSASSANTVDIDLRKLFTTAMEGRNQRPFGEVMAIALKKCGVIDSKAYYRYLDQAVEQNIVHREVHPETGATWIVLDDNTLPF